MGANISLAPQDMGEIPEDTEAAILDTLVRIKRKDPLIYQPEVHFFKKDDDDDGEEGKGSDGIQQEGVSEKKVKPLYLKDVIAKQV